MNWKCPNCQIEKDAADGTPVRFCPNCGAEQKIDGIAADNLPKAADNLPKAAAGLLALDQKHLARTYRSSLYLQIMGILTYTFAGFLLLVAILAGIGEDSAFLYSSVIFFFVVIPMFAFGYVLWGVRTCFAKWVVRILSSTYILCSILIFFARANFHPSNAYGYGSITGAAFVVLFICIVMLFVLLATFNPVLFSKHAPTHAQIVYVRKSGSTLASMPPDRYFGFMDAITPICASLLIFFLLFMTLGLCLQDREAMNIKAAIHAAEQGDVDTQMSLAYRYKLGLGVEQNITESFRWYLQAAEHGNPVAQSLVGNEYLLGKAVKRDVEEAKKWSIKASSNGDEGAFTLFEELTMRKNIAYISTDSLKMEAEKGNAESQYSLGTRYLLGTCVEQDEAEGTKWIMKAAGNGHAGSQYLLGMMYMRGLGVERDPDKAKEWFQKAADQGIGIAKQTLDHMRR